MAKLPCPARRIYCHVVTTTDQPSTEEHGPSEILYIHISNFQTGPTIPSIVGPNLFLTAAWHRTPFLPDRPGTAGWPPGCPQSTSYLCFGEAAGRPSVAEGNEKERPEEHEWRATADMHMYMLMCTCICALACICLSSYLPVSDDNDDDNENSHYHRSHKGQSRRNSTYAKGRTHTHTIFNVSIVKLGS